MRTLLHPHPQTLASPVREIAVDIAREGETLELCYIVSADPEALRWPPPSEPTRADGLWKHTCFEAFVLGGDGQAYLEHNFAPSSAWAAYAFDAYRTGMRNAACPAPRIAASRAREVLTLRATIAAPRAGFRLGLSAVIEDLSGARSFWALAHPEGHPDFHRPDCFALEIASTSGS
jgi:hypothetical protein